MFSSTRAAVAAAVAIVALTSFPALGFGAERVAGTAMPAVDFTLASDGTYVAGVVPSIPPRMLADVMAAPAAPASPAPVAQRPIDMAMPRGEGGFSETTLRRGMYGSFAALQIMDAISTNKALSAGGVEANPAMSGVVKNKNAFMAVKVGAAVATAFFSEKLAKNHPRKATILMAVLNVAYAGIVVHNYNVSRSAR
jgi:Domain of unknown function (DUF5658)